MNPIIITKERAEQLLPQNVKESTELSDDAKNVLAAIINYYVSLDAAKTNGYVFLTNPLMQQTLRKNNNKIKAAEQELVECGLIRIERGGSKIVDGRRTANKFFVNWDNLNKPIKRPTFDELLKGFLRKDESPEKPIGTIDIVIDKDIDIVIDKDIDTGSGTGSGVEQVNNLNNNLCNNKTYSLHNNVTGKTSSPVEKKFEKQVKVLEDLELKKKLEEELRQWAERVNSQNTYQM